MPAHMRAAARSLVAARHRPPVRAFTAAALPLPPAGTTLSAPTNPFVKACVRLRDTRAARLDTGAVLLTGADLVAECCAPGGGARARAVVLPADGQPAPALAAAAAAAGRTLYASPAVLAKLAGVANADGGVEGAAAAAAAAVVDAPADAAWLGDANATPPPPRDATFHRVLALDGVQDPGNVGTLARAALALGWDGLLLLPGTADPLHPRALRAARGGVFRLPHGRAGGAAAVVELADRHGWALIAAEVRASPSPTPAVPPSARGAVLVLGAERRGVTPALSAAAASVAIPMAVGEEGGAAVESFNVATAGALLMAALTPRVGGALAKALYGE